MPRGAPRSAVSARAGRSPWVMPLAWFARDQASSLRLWAPTLATEKHSVHRDLREPMSLALRDDDRLCLKRRNLREASGLRRGLAVEHQSLD